MAEQNSTFQIELHGRSITVKRPTDGQVESMIRIATGLRAGDDQPQDYWIKYVQRLNRLLDSLIEPDDQDYVDELYETGKISSSVVLRALLEANRDASEPKAPKNGPVKKAAVRRVRSR